MNIAVPTVGSRGDVQPYIALSRALAEAGHSVTLASHPAMRALVEGGGVRFAAVGPEIDLAAMAAKIRYGSPSWLLGFKRLFESVFAALEQSHAELLALCRTADLVIVSHLGAGSIEADALSLPTASVTFTPEALPATASSSAQTRSPLAGPGLDRLITRPFNRLRGRLGVRPMGPHGILSPRLNLMPLSPRVSPPDAAWAPQHRLVGYWLSDQGRSFVPPATLAAFIAAGERPIVVSLGAMSLGGEDAGETAEVLLEAVARAGVRAVVQGFDGVLDEARLPARAFHAPPVPHEWLLAQAALVVHHGGFGTTAAAFHAGVPSVVIPHIVDQFIWGDRVARLGVGPTPIPRRELTAEKLAAAITETLRDATLRARAAALRDELRSETGLQTAVRLIEALA
jgi:sterol 3beta-glucosyltransferase